MISLSYCIILSHFKYAQAKSILYQNFQLLWFQCHTYCNCVLKSLIICQLILRPVRKQHIFCRLISAAVLENVSGLYMWNSAQTNSMTQRNKLFLAINTPTQMHTHSHTILINNKGTFIVGLALYLNQTCLLTYWSFKYCWIRRMRNEGKWDCKNFPTEWEKIQQVSLKRVSL